MSVIKGKAKRFDGSPVDYVLLFDWQSGDCIGKAVPDAQGNWAYRHFADINCGITYVADGCEPITHGAYHIVAPDMPSLPILHYPLDGNTIDYSASKLNGIQSGALSFVEGRQTGTQAMQFVNGCVRTSSHLPISGYQATISFWAALSSYAGDQIIVELSSAFNNYNAFLINIESSSLRAAMHANVGFNQQQSLPSIGDWHHIVVAMNRQAPTDDQIKIYVDNVDRTGNVSGWLNKSMQSPFESQTLYIGQRASASVPFVGKMQDLRVYNRILTATERTQLFNE